MKKNKNLKIELPNPCHEDWGKMTQAGKGRFCGSCEKIVIDFTHKTNQELIDFFVTKSQRACGRFRSNQIDRLIGAEQEPKARWWPNAFAASVLSLLSFAGISQETIPTKAEVIIETEMEPEIDEHIKMGEAPIDSITIANFNGTVLDQNGNRIGYAKIKIHDFDTTIVARADGKFDVSLYLKGKSIQSYFNAKLSASGYYETDIQLPAFGEEIEYIMTKGEPIEMPLRPEYDQLGGTPQIFIQPIEVKKSKRKFWIWKNN